MCILVVKETVYDNGTSCKRLTAKVQAYKERGVFHFAKKDLTAFCPDRIEVFGRDHNDKTGNFSKTVLSFLPQGDVSSQHGSEWPGQGKVDTCGAVWLYFLSFPKWEEHVRGSCSVQWKQTSFGETMQPRHIQSLSLIHWHKELE